MREFLRWGSWALLGGALLTLIPTSEESLPAVGEVTQDRTVVDLDGEILQLLGPDSATLIMVVADWCPASRKFLASATSQVAIQSVGDAAFRLLILGDNEDGIVHLSRLAPWARPAVHDATGRLTKALGVSVVPTVVLVEDNVIKWSRQAGDGSVSSTNLAAK